MELGLQVKTEFQSHGNRTESSREVGFLMTRSRPLAFVFFLTALPFPLMAQGQSPAAAPAVMGYADFAAQAKIEEKFLAVPDAKLAGQHLKTLTAAPHLASTPEDHKTAEYVAEKFRAAGLETETFPTACC